MRSGSQFVCCKLVCFVTWSDSPSELAIPARLAVARRRVVDRLRYIRWRVVQVASIRANEPNALTRVGFGGNS
jgi:hypothetical protein